MNRAGREQLFRPKLVAVSVAACFALNAGMLRANPTGPTVVGGGVGFSGLGTSALTITNQAGGNAIINWNGFSIGINELTRFQQFANLAVLNRVTGNQVSSILGSLQSDGRVFLINPNGIVFGPGARIDTAGLVASSLGLSDQDFLANRLRFTEVPGAGAVVNNGVIETAAGGRVYLVAPTVENNGLIQSPQGAIVLAAGKEVELVDAASPFVTVKVAAAEQAVNVGNLVAAGGQIGMFGALVRNSGVVEAGGAVAGPGGEIRLVAAQDLTLDAGSVVSANGTSGGKILLQAEGGTNLVGGTVEARGSSGRGGAVSALGVRVGVVGHGVIDASGDTGGGSVLVGGDYQGKNAAVQNAERTYIGSDGVIRADAMTTGNGGRVIAWADGDTRFYGSISARGGSAGGNGGFVETSGKGALEAFGYVNVAAPSGQGGTWLLDPTNININPGDPPDSGQIATDGLLLFGEFPGDTTVGLGSIEAAFVYGIATVQLQATNDITFNGNLNITNSGNLTLQAGNDIRFNSYSLSTNGNLDLQAAAFGGTPVTGAISAVPGGGNITTNGGSLSASGYSVALGNINTNATGLVSTPGGGNVFISSSNGATVTGGITTGGGYVNLYAFGAGALSTVTVNGPINTSNIYGYIGDSSNGSVYISAAGDVTTSSITTASLHPGHYNGGDVELYTDTGKVTVNGNIDTRGASGFDDGISSWYYGGTAGGNVTLSRSAGDGFTGTAVTVNGSILTAGGNGLSLPSTLFGNNHGGGSGGGVSVADYCDGLCGTLPGGFAVTGTIDTSGGNGGSTSNTSAATSGGDAGYVDVAVYGSVSLGSIISRGGNAGAGSDGAYGNAGGWGGNLSISAGGSVLIGAIDISGGSGANAGGSVAGNSTGGWGGDGGSIDITGTAGVSIASILGRGGVAGTGGAAGGYTYAYGGDGGDGSSVYVSSSGGVSIGSVDISGARGGAGGAATDYAWGGSGGSGGYLSLSGSSVSVGSIAGIGANGGSGGSAIGGISPYSYGGDGGSGAGVYVSATGAVNIGPVNISGGHGATGGTGDQYSWGGGGGQGGYLEVYADSISVGAIIGRSGNGGQGGTGNDASGGGSDYGAGIYFNATGGIVAGNIDVSGGNGGSGGAGVLYASGGNGYYGGAVTMNGSSISTGSILTMGGAGGTGGTISNGDGDSSGGGGGWGGSVQLAAYDAQLRQQVLLQDQFLVQQQALVGVSPSFTLSAGGPLTTGFINASGGDGGNSGAVGSSFTSGGSGGGASSFTGVQLFGSTVDVKGPILAKGGNGGDIINASLPPSQALGTPVAGNGGYGGSVYVYGTGAVRLNVGGTLGATAIDLSGGVGGAGNAAASPAGNGGAGGGGGAANVVGTPNMTLFGSVLAGGGAGGAGGAGNATNIGGNGGVGGGAGTVYLDASSIAGPQTGDGIIFVLAGTQFNVQGGQGGAGGADGGAGAGLPGTSGLTGSFLPLTDYFGTILVLDPLSVPEINQGFQQIVEGNDDTTAFVGGEKKDEEEDKSQKELASCKG